MIARCLVHHDYSPVHIPTQKDEQVKEFIRMRDGTKLYPKKWTRKRPIAARNMVC